MSLNSADGSQLGSGLNHLQSTPRAEEAGNEINDYAEFQLTKPGSLAPDSAVKLRHLAAYQNPALKANKRPKTGQHRESRLDQRLGGMVVNFTKGSLKGRN